MSQPKYELGFRHATGHTWNRWDHFTGTELTALLVALQTALDDRADSPAPVHLMRAWRGMSSGVSEALLSR